MSAPRRRVAVLISGRGSNMAALLTAVQQADYPAEIAVVIANRPDAGGLAAAVAAGVPTAVIDHKAYGGKPAFEAGLHAELLAHRVDLVCLAGFMRVLSADFVARWPGSILNIHPSLLPSFPGLDSHARALSAGVRLHGCTVHLVAAEVDAGPIIAQAAVPVLAGDTAEALAARVLAAEHRLYPHALALLASGAARLVDGRVIVDGGDPGAVLMVPAA